jgi:predicted Na+-dependent transporter
MLSIKKTANLAQKLNRWLERLIPFTTPFSIVMGFVLSGVFVNLRPLVPWLFGIMTFSGALKLKATELGAAVKTPLPILLFFAAAHVLMPVFSMLSSSLFFTDPDVIAGFILLFSGPTAVSGFIWVSIFKGDLALCLTLILLDTLLAPILVPGSISVLMSTKIAMDMSGIALSLLFMVVIPTVIGVTINETSKGKIPSSLCPFVDPIAKICLMTVIATNASVIAPSVKFNDPLIWKIAVLVVILIFAGFALIKLITVIGKCRFPKDTTIILCSGLRNNSAIMTIAVAFFPQTAVLPVLICIIIQQSIAAIAGKILFAKNDKLQAAGG